MNPIHRHPSAHVGCRNSRNFKGRSVTAGNICLNIFTGQIYMARPVRIFNLLPLATRPNQPRCPVAEGVSDASVAATQRKHANNALPTERGCAKGQPQQQPNNQPPHLPTQPGKPIKLPTSPPTLTIPKSKYRNLISI